MIFFDFDNPVKKKLHGKSENLYKPYKVHDYEQLLLLSGIYSEFETELNNPPVIKSHWSIVNQGNENSRYEV